MSLCVCKERARRCLAFSSTEGNINYSCRENVQPVCACVFRFSPGARARLFLNVMHNGHVIIDTINIRCTPCNIYTYCTMHIIGNTSKVCVCGHYVHTHIYVYVYMTCTCTYIRDIIRHVYVRIWNYITDVRAYVTLFYTRTYVYDVILRARTYTYEIYYTCICTYAYIYVYVYVHMYVQTHT